MTSNAKLQVLIATCGRRIENIPPLPVVPEVAYLIGWQLANRDLPTELAERTDISVLYAPGKGSSKNRNFLLDNAEADLLLIADDDIVYAENALDEVIRAFNSNPDCQMLTFRHTSTIKTYPDKSYNLLSPPKGASPSCFDIALRRNSSAGKLRFDERFGIDGTLFSAAEDDIFILNARKSGIQGRYIPLTLCTHPTRSTGERAPDKNVIEAWGAYIAIAYPAWQWFLRLPLKAFRLAKSGRSPLWSSLRYLMAGIKKLN